ncbi:hypothetical protein FRC20_001685 [Serendipita sp. 405]|nr:hypothetical protein FRC15_002363 [Serendipita sp. 397]KAG8851630.1 hypothetical protein FRC20_001685 [Serendipita sp. 405]
MHLQSWSLLATTLAYLTAGTSAAGLAFNGANAPSQVLLLDDSWEKTADGSITTKKGELIVMGNSEHNSESPSISKPHRLTI